MQIPACIHIPAALLRPIRHRLGERRTIAEFGRLDAATLRDIGLDRSAARRETQAQREQLWRQPRQAGM